MALFLLICTDRPGARELRAKTRDTHLAYLAEHAATVKLAGPWLDEADGGANGSMLVVEAEDLAAARAFAAADPYAEAGVFEHVEVNPWRLVIGGFA